VHPGQKLIKINVKYRTLMADQMGSGRGLKAKVGMEGAS
jgi:hypothetical protein